ncbi:hypothetical protein SAY86_017507 [Trapa natans]|uniref:Uncharacterized protein n=1 Tax=Trapa natans TaxID=22666 RepID=A0AAN7R8W8_TRANT|nr:hypothetical protein SAY86_017507 [Trapa natans]
MLTDFILQSQYKPWKEQLGKTPTQEILGSADWGSGVLGTGLKFNRGNAAKARQKHCYFESMMGNSKVCKTWLISCHRAIISAVTWWPLSVAGSSEIVNSSS